MDNDINIIKNYGDAEKLMNYIEYELYETQFRVEEYFFSDFTDDQVVVDIFMEELSALFENYREMAHTLVDSNIDNDDMLFEEIQDDSYEGDYYA